MSNKTDLQANNARIEAFIADGQDLPPALPDELGNATTADVLSGKTFTSDDGVMQTGALDPETLKKGNYVWKELTEEGGELRKYVVSDKESAYPDGGTQDGYWYEKISNSVLNIKLGGWYTYKSDESSMDIPYSFYDGELVIFEGEIHILGSPTNSTKHYKWNGSSWVSVSTLPYEFYNGSAVVLNNEIHILGSESNLTKHYKWNGSSWVSVSTLPYPFYKGSAVVLNNEIHIFGGNAGTSEREYHYKWNGSSWVSVSTLPYAFYSGSTIVLNNEIHILGGPTNSTKHYKWNGSSWTSVSTLPYAFNSGDSVVLNNEIHILGGSGNTTKHYAYAA